MRLIRCYIENFGGLSQYRLDFREGLTVILEGNGFGKTTLAEFIRAMFYGFPRAGKNLEKNPRKKYAPWNGGAYGGNLTFSHNRKVYRIDRRFGATPKGDTFELTDAATHKKSTDFSDNIGLELFGLDADSFGRSTYMPQTHDNAAFATAGIQSKLSDLVHDTGDIGNYDNAIRALREKRSGYIPYRGKGGSVAEALGMISGLQDQLDQAELQRTELEQLLVQLAQIRADHSAKNDARATIRTQIREQAQYEAASSAQKQLLGLEQRKRRLEEQMQALAAQYPRGLPSLNEAAHMEQLLGRLPLLMPREQTQTDLDARSTVEQLGSRFAAGIPEDALFARLRRMDTALIEAESARKAAILTDQEQTQLTELDAFFAPGVPEEEALSRNLSDLRELTALEDRLSHLSPADSDRRQLEQLEAFFAKGLPEESAMEDCQELLNRAAALRQENLRISASMESRILENAPADPSKAPLVPMLLGFVLACLGIAGVILEYLVPGIIALALGITLFAAGFALKLKQDVSSQLRAAVPDGAGLSEADRERIRENTRQIDILEKQAAAFTGGFFPNGGSPSEQLAAIRSNRARYLELVNRQRSLQAQSAELEDSLAALRKSLCGFLAPYFGTEGDPDDQLRLLQLRRAQYADLVRKKETCAARAAQLERDCATLRSQLDSALSPYFPQGIADHTTLAIARLEQDSRRFAAALSHLEEQRRLEEVRAEELRTVYESLRSFSRTYALTLDLADPEQFHRLRTHISDLPRLRREIHGAAQELQEFRQEHARLLRLSPREDLPDAQALKASEELLTGQLQHLERELAALEQKKRVLFSRVDAIAQIRDDLEHWQEIRLRDTRNCALLDQTIQFLEQGRENLSARYMGTVRSRFVAYMNRISGEDRDRIFVTPELEVTMERLGEPRPLEHFSAGQTDIVNVCMRLALVDALFRDTCPLLILDDPFVNLDERNLKQALAVLEELSRDHQILYLVCSSSRVPSSLPI